LPTGWLFYRRTGLLSRVFCPGSWGPGGTRPGYRTAVVRGVFRRFQWSQFLPAAISTFRGTSSSITSSISFLTRSMSSSFSFSGTSKTSSSWTCMIMADFSFLFRIR